MKKIVLVLTIFFLNLLDIYLKYSLENKYYHDISYRLFFIPVIFFLFLYLTINMPKKERKELVFYFFLILLSSISNIVDLIINKGKIINYINFYFFYNNISDILIFFVTSFIIVKYLKNKDKF